MTKLRYLNTAKYGDIDGVCAHKKGDTNFFKSRLLVPELPARENRERSDCWGSREERVKKKMRRGDRIGVKPCVIF